MYCPIECRSADQRHAGRENSFALLAFAFAVELLPPLGHIKQLRIVAAQNLDLAALAIERRPRGSVKSRRIPLEGHVRSGGLLHILRAADQLVDVRTPAAASGSRPTGVRHRIASADIIGNHERGIAFLRRKCPQGSALGVGHGDDPLGRLGLAVARLDLLFDQAERDGRLGRRARLGNDDRSDPIGLHGGQELREIVLAQVLPREQQQRPVLLLAQQLEGVVHRFVHGFRPEVRSPDPDHDDHIGERCERAGARLDGFELLGADPARQGNPAQKIAALAAAVVQHPVGRLDLAFQRIDLGLRSAAVDLVDIHIDNTHDSKLFGFISVSRSEASGRPPETFPRRGCHRRPARSASRRRSAR